MIMKPRLAALLMALKAAFDEKPALTKIPVVGAAPAGM